MISQVRKPLTIVNALLKNPCGLAVPSCPLASTPKAIALLRLMPHDSGMTSGPCLRGKVTPFPPPFGSAEEETGKNAAWDRQL